MAARKRPRRSGPLSSAELAEAKRAARAPIKGVGTFTPNPKSPTPAQEAKRKEIIRRIKDMEAYGKASPAKKAAAQRETARRLEASARKPTTSRKKKAIRKRK